VSLPLTGERTVPHLREENYWFRRHLAAYRAAARLCRGARVLEAGAGEGYGAAAVRAAGAATVVALDYDTAAVGHLRVTYRLPAVRANLVALPFQDRAFDVVLSLQTIEHLWDQPRFLAECARTLAPGGRLVLTTPNRRTFPGGNPYHSRELDAAELSGLIADTGLRVDALLGVHHGERLAGYPGDLVSDQLAVPPSEWPGSLAAVVAGVTTADFVLSADDLDSCLDLLAVAVRS
jgi:SAM-dependent methyltransferase